MISKGTGSGDPSPALTQDYTNKCKNATVPHAVTARDSAQRAYICDQDPAGDIRERLEKSSVPDFQEQDNKQRQTDGQCNGKGLKKAPFPTLAKWRGLRSAACLPPILSPTRSFNMPRETKKGQLERKGGYNEVGSIGALAQNRGRGAAALGSAPAPHTRTQTDKRAAGLAAARRAQRARPPLPAHPPPARSGHSPEERRGRCPPDFLQGSRSPFSLFATQSKCQEEDSGGWVIWSQAGRLRVERLRGGSGAHTMAARSSPCVARPQPRAGSPAGSWGCRNTDTEASAREAQRQSSRGGGGGAGRRAEEKGGAGGGDTRHEKHIPWREKTAPPFLLRQEGRAETHSHSSPAWRARGGRPRGVNVHQGCGRTMAAGHPAPAVGHAEHSLGSPTAVLSAKGCPHVALTSKDSNAKKQRTLTQAKLLIWL
ncbi:uncharacterized protein AAES06_018500 [Glossophaga mutica]